MKRITSATVTVRAHCPLCGDVQLPIAQVTLYRANRPDDSHLTYRHCGELRTVTVDADQIDALTRGGVPVVRVPAEALEVHEGPAIGWDDVLDFVLAMEAAGATRIPSVPDARMP